MSHAKLIVDSDGIEAQFRLVVEDEEPEEGEINDDEDDDEDQEGDDGHMSDDQLNLDKDSNSQDRENRKTHNEGTCKTTHPDKDSPEIGQAETTQKTSKRISLFEMQSFLVALILPGPRLSTPPNWCKVIRCMRAPNVGIFLLDNDDLDWIKDKGSKFSHAFRFHTAPDWIERLTSVPLSRRLQDLNSDFGQRNYESDLNMTPRIPKTSLLLSPVQMIAECYPMPCDQGINILKSKFSAVDDHSPMFAIDCEMCITDRSELTKLSIVDEELRIVYNELVKPEAPITNYLTRYSGITMKMMEHVTNTIEDVHYFMRKTLPRDAILCGHSLNMDLNALQIFHPYVVDTSVIYNRAGIRSHKPSLKSLAYSFLGKEIQTVDKLGHDSLEDAMTTMELVKLKLVNGSLFGDSVWFEKSEGIKYDSKTGVTHLQIDKFIQRHDTSPLSYRIVDTTPGARCLYVHDNQEPLDQEVKDAILYLLDKPHAICVVLTSSGECYVKF